MFNVSIIKTSYPFYTFLLFHSYFIIIILLYFLFKFSVLLLNFNKTINFWLLQQTSLAHLSVKRCPFNLIRAAFDDGFTITTTKLTHIRNMPLVSRKWNVAHYFHTQTSPVDNFTIFTKKRLSYRLPTINHIMSILSSSYISSYY